MFAFSPTVLFYGGAQFVLIALAMMIAILQPYKPQFSVYNAVDSVLVLFMALWCATIVCTNIAGLKAHRWLKFSVVLSFIVGILPLIYISFVTLHWICCERKFAQRMIGKILRGNTEQGMTVNLEESLPDRLINPVEYEEDPEAVQFEDKEN